MAEEDRLCVIWSSGDREVALKMVFMYTYNAKAKGWWNTVRFVIWGPAIYSAMYRGWPRRWRRYHRHWSRHHGPMHSGPMPPWCRDWEEPSEEEGAEGKSDAE